MIVNWDEFQKAKQRLIGDATRPMLLMNGTQGDNRTVWVLEGTAVQNTKGNLFGPGWLENSDFVWGGGEFVQCVRLGHPAPNGHPGLASTNTIYCAGILVENGFFFHSGHYHPTVENAKHFFVAFVEQSCNGLSGQARDDLVDDLCNMTLTFYVEGSTTRTYNTTFQEIAEPEVSDTTQSADSSGGGSYQPPRSAPISIGRSPAIVAPPSSPPVVTFRASGPAEWIADELRSQCGSCRTPFSLFVRKHHCRKCGEIFCDHCSMHRMVVHNPARRPGAPMEHGPVRVCKGCSIGAV
ncbi:FYVE zinc finger domain-containing protein [Sorangium sp. So ce1000]|uniref:FYVE zinc finger domain-containing protein n=1 Tax=Sorangium sp. So ce1000 TaxID=3133325 RepID=UPI003F5FBF1F